MPSDLHPQAKFDPIPPDLDLSALVEKCANFDYVIRIGLDQIEQLGLAEFEKLVLMHVVIGGKPLVVEGWQATLPSWLFSSAWLQDNLGKKHEKVRDIGNSTDIPMTIGHYLNSMGKLTKQWTNINFRDPKRQRLYLKDIDCPDLWQIHLANHIPQMLFYLNECIGEKGGPGAIHERNTYNQLVLGQGIASAGDLMSSLPPEMRAENLMCYIGHEGTYTPAHREMCASLGQNIMVENSEAEKGEIPGSSIWFMTESKDREVVSEYFLSTLGHDIEIENHFAQINAWKKAPFAVYVVEQKVGDFILIPPLAPHQVWNRGTRTMKVAWNRTTIETLELALHEAVPRARMVCRDEQYKNKAIVYYSLLKYYDQLKRVEQLAEQAYTGFGIESIRNSGRIRHLQRDFKRLFTLYTEVLVSEMFSSDLPQEKGVEFVPFDSNVTCSYCRCNIFNRFLTCKTCIYELDTGEEDTYDICMDCYAMGRSCGCISNLKWVEQWQWSALLQKYDDWRHMVTINDEVINDDSPPQSLDIARARNGKKSIAQVCQEQLKLRPWHDISKPTVPEPLSGGSDAEPETDDKGKLKRKSVSRRKSDMRKKSHMNCHVCRKQEWLWKLALCTTCPNAYCYGSLWRAFDLKPEAVMELPDWQCPKCQKICSCGACRRITNPNMAQIPYRPKGTLLGHDTRLVADPRSVESLVNFSRPNLFWLKDDDEEDAQSSSRIQKLVEKARAEKERDDTMDEEFEIDEGELQNRHNRSIPSQLQDQSLMAIDPQLSQSSYTAFLPNMREDQILVQAPVLVDNSAISSPGTHSQYTELHLPDQHVNSNTHSHGVVDDHHKTSNTRLEFVAPEATMLTWDGSSEPENKYKGESTIDVVTYQQPDDADQILFSDPETTTQTGQGLNTSFPRILRDDEGCNDLKSKKRKRSSLPRTTSNSDEAHLQSQKKQKKQNPNKAKKNGTSFMTQKQFDGSSDSLIVTLSLKTRRGFLQQLREQDDGKKDAKNNPQPAQIGISAPPQNPNSEEDFTIVTSDLQDSVRWTDVRHEKSDVEDESIIIATQAIQNLAKQASVTTTRDESKLPDGIPGRSIIAVKSPPSRVRGKERLRAIADNFESNRPLSEHLSRKHSEQSDTILIGLPYKKQNLRQQLTFSDNKFENGSAVDEWETSGQEPQSPKTVEREIEDEAIPEQAIINTPSGTASVDHEYAPVDQEDEFEVFDDYYQPIVLLSKSSTPPVNPITPTAQSSGYQNAKLVALRIAEGQVEDDSAHRALRKVVSPTSSSNTAAVLKKDTNSPSIPIPTSTESTFMSMAERRAAQGKPFKIVARKSSTNSSLSTKPTAAEGTNRIPMGPVVDQKTPGILHTCSVNGISDGSEGASSFDEDEEIPAVRPPAVRPGGANGKICGSLEMGKTVGQTRGKTMFSRVK